MRIRPILLIVVMILPTAAKGQLSDACPIVVDSTGARIGRLQGQQSLYLQDQSGALAGFQVGQGGLIGNEPVYFTMPGCTDDMFMDVGFAQNSLIIGTSLWYPDTTAPIESITSVSRLVAGGICQSFSTPRQVFPAIETTLPNFVPPFHLEAEDCNQSPMVASITTPGLLVLGGILAFTAFHLVRRNDTRRAA